MHGHGSDALNLFCEMKNAGEIPDGITFIDQTIEFVRKMPKEADAVIWAALLGACRIYKNIELAEVALDQLIKLELKNPSNFVMLSNIYGDLGRWKDVA
ncbi:hypothetical protein SO802_008339 [Lithocarpus litseifolius]|uniref:Pentatricopeptide repeat-containing protein n=1 Tax=Lithocarpus litseifolius TaxID=425828 RepID=A0AAW2D8W0_9ROSI